MRRSCRRVAEAWGAHVDDVTLEFGIGTEEPWDYWRFTLWVQPADTRRGRWEARGDGNTVEEAAQECIDMRDECSPEQLPAQQQEERRHGV